MMPYTLAVFLGGFWAEYFNWRWLFYANATIGIVISLLVFALLYGRTYERKHVELDYTGLILFAVTIISLQLMLSQGNDITNLDLLSPNVHYLGMGRSSPPDRCSIICKIILFPRMSFRFYWIFCCPGHYVFNVCSNALAAGLFIIDSRRSIFDYDARGTAAGRLYV